MPPLAIIPVLDLMRGRVVRARAGERALYRPIETPLAPSSMPHDVLRGFLALAPFPSFYIADLDSIGGNGDHGSVLEALARETPQAELWVDGGVAAAADAEVLAARGLVPVLGSETLSGGAALDEATARLGASRFVLSLDWRGGRFMGAPELWAATEFWPERVILMTLDRVGMAAGPDLAGLEALVARAGRRRVFAAGGVRHAADLEALRAIGVAGALVASALHDGRLPRETVMRFLRPDG